jgi:hypothetical protein
MKTEQVIIYDSCCPMCAWYTGVFIRTGLLPANGRQTFNEIDHHTMRMIDPDISRHEIPLVDKETGEVRYGVEAILDIIGSRFPLVKRICSTKPLNRIIKFVYKTISYNRRVIVAAGKNNGGFDSTPDFSFKYRSVMLVLGCILNTLILFPLTASVFHNSLFATKDMMQVQLAHIVFVACNVFVATHFNRRDAFEYLGQVNMLALIAMLLTLPLILLNNVFIVPAMVNNLALTVILFVIVKDYFRRMKYAGVLDNHSKAVPVNIFCLIMFLLYLSN